MARGQQVPRDADLEYSAGSSVLLYGNVYSVQASFSVDAAVRGAIAGHWYWEAGARMGLGPSQPEVFGRLVAAHEVGAWHPFVGLELGYTRRAVFTDGGTIVRETRSAMEGEISPFYGAVHAAPLKFELLKGVRVSFIEIQVGTHLSHIGRTLRAQLGMISVGADL